MAFANITFVETQVRAAARRSRSQLPMIPGNGVGGRRERPARDRVAGRFGRLRRAARGRRGLRRARRMALDDAVALLADGRTA